MSFDATNVELGFNVFTRFANNRRLGKPSKVLVRDPDVPAWGAAGVGAQWDIEGQEPVRVAVQGKPEDIAEIKRRLKEWMAE